MTSFFCFLHTCLIFSNLQSCDTHRHHHGDRVQPCCPRWCAWGRADRPHHGPSCDGLDCCDPGGCPGAHWRGELCVIMAAMAATALWAWAPAACWCLGCAVTRAAATTTLSATAATGRALGVAGRRRRSGHRRHCQHTRAALSPPPPWPPPWLALLVRMRSIISVRAALAAACITSRLGGLPRRPRWSGGPWQWARPFHQAQGQSLR